jgi:hypothetical protein
MHERPPGELSPGTGAVQHGSRRLKRCYAAVVEKSNVFGAQAWRTAGSCFSRRLQDFDHSGELASGQSPLRSPS